MSNVIQFPTAETYDGAVCSCGSAWFRLTSDDPVHELGAACLSREGNVTGWSGGWECIECGLRLRIALM